MTVSPATIVPGAVLLNSKGYDREVLEVWEPSTVTAELRRVGIWPDRAFPMRVKYHPQFGGKRVGKAKWCDLETLRTWAKAVKTA